MIFIGFIIGFLGYLPPGNINLTVIQMSIGSSRTKLWYYIVFASVMEFVYCFGSLFGMKYLVDNPHWIIILEWSSVVLFCVLGLISLLHKPSSDTKSPPGLRRGILVAIFNPLQIPFWLIWGSYVLQNDWVHHTILSIALFSIITASGTVAILWLYAIAGKKMQAYLTAHQRAMNVIIGCLFLGLAVLELFKILHPKRA